MPNLPPIMSHLQKQVRAEAKKQLLLAFLASGEVYTSADIAARVMSCSRTCADRTLSSLALSGSLKFETHYVNSRKMHLYGITPHGLVMVDVFDKPHFELGRTNSSYIPHHLETQQARLAAEAAGWTNWRPGKILYNTALKKVPDALITDPAGNVVAIECERHIKTLKRYEEILSLHLQEMTQRKWREVHYLTPPGLAKRVEAVFLKIESVRVNGNREPLEQKHRARFKFYEQKDWPPKGGY